MEYFLQAQNGPGATSAPYEGLVDSLILLKRLDEAQSFLDAWKARTDAAADQGKICYLSGRLAEARGDLNQALEADPRHFGAWLGMGFVLEQLGGETEALESYREALKIYPLMPQAKAAEARLTLKAEGLEL